MNAIKRSKCNRYIGGVCGGIAEWSDTSALAWRIIFLLVPSSLLVYLFLWILLKKQ